MQILMQFYGLAAIHAAGCHFVAADVLCILLAMMSIPMRSCRRRPQSNYAP